MGGSLLPAPVFRAVDVSGKPISGALLQFYAGGTTEPQTVFTTAALSVALPNPVQADSAGLFPPIYVDATLSYRAQLKSAGGVLIQDIDPCFAPNPPAPGSITGAMLGPTAVDDSLGFTPLNVDGDTALGELVLGYSLSAPPEELSVGFRGAPVIQIAEDRTFGPNDSGKSFRHVGSDSHAWTIPPFSETAFEPGTIFVTRCQGVAVTLTRGAGVVLSIAGSGTSQDVTLAQNGFGSLFCEAQDNWVFSGTGGS